MKRMIALLLALAILTTLAGCSGGKDPKTAFGSEKPFSLDLPDTGVGVDYGTPDAEPAPQDGQSAAAQSGAMVQLTMEDIQKMNGDNVVIDIYNNSGYLSTLVGKFYEGKVQNAEDGVESVKGIASLLGLTKGCEFFAVYYETDNDGYSYYTYQQRYGRNTLQYATLRIAVDPDGYTAGLTCSFVPNIGTASQEAGISQQDAEAEALRRASDGCALIQGRTVELAAYINNVVYNCWVVYTNNPDASASFDMPYLAHYISTDGDYLMALPANNFAASNTELMDNDAYFENLRAENVSFTVKQPAGGSKQITVPISKNTKDGKYYLMDPSRKIAVARFKDFYYQDKLNFVSSGAKDSGWSDNDLMAYFNYINVYDFYHERGIHSIDGFDVPLLITVGYCDEKGNPVDNACFYGVNAGWACFAASDANKYSYCADVCGHEFTHGVTSSSMQGIYYQNETGAINEAYSDIMGNLCEKLTGQTSDSGWLIAENSGGGAMRDMADPNSCEQPAYVGDRYYVPAVLVPTNANDLGGVHGDNSLISHLAYLLDREGMSMDEQFSMWMTSIELLTPMSDYEDLHGILLFSLKINGMLENYGPTVNQAFAETGLNEDWNTSYLEATKSGCGRVTFQTDGYIAGLPAMAVFGTTEGTVVDCGYPDRNGVVSVLLPAGTYITAFQYLEEGKSESTVNRYTGSAWSKTQGFGTFTVKSGGVTTLPALSSGKRVDVGGDGTPAPASGGALNLVSFNGGYFTLLVPEGWRIEVGGEYGSFNFKLFDPYNPSCQVFFYGGLAPFHKSEQSRRYLSYYDTTGGLISNGPVLTSPTVRGITDCWQYCIEYQKRYEGKQMFTDLRNINLAVVSAYEGPYAGMGAETVGVGACTDSWGNDCILGVAGTLIDLDFYGYYGGNWYYTCYDLLGVVCPAEDFDLYYEDLLTCAKSIQFSQDYISASQYSNLPLVDNATLTQNMSLIAGVIAEQYEAVR